MFAAAHNHADCVKILAPLENRMKDKYGWTALMRAAYYGNIECVKILAQLENGMKNNYKDTAKEIASK